jgi:hypothetical protein
LLHYQFMKASFLLCLAFSAFLLACGKKESPARPAPQSGGGVSVEALAGSAAPAPPPQPGASAPNETPGADAAGDGPVANMTPEQEASLAEITQAIQTWMQVNSDYPKDFKQLVDAKLIKKLPTPPPGKRLAIDRKTIRVIYVDK